MSNEFPDIVRRRHRLAVRFMEIDGRMDTVAQIEPRIGNAANYFAFRIFTDEIRAEIERRGYDLTTMRFHIDRKKSVAKKWDSRPSSADPAGKDGRDAR